jgi:hypothetical protein
LLVGSLRKAGVPLPSNAESVLWGKMQWRATREWAGMPALDKVELRTVKLLEAAGMEGMSDPFWYDMVVVCWPWFEDKAVDWTLAKNSRLKTDLRKANDGIEHYRHVIRDMGVRPPAVKRRTRRPPLQPKEHPLTPRQTEVVQLYGELKGNISAVAKSLSRDPTSIRECLDAAYRKLGKAGWRNRDTRPGKRGRFKAGKLPTGKDGQEAVAGQDDGPAPTRPVRGVLRDKLAE